MAVAVPLVASWAASAMGASAMVSTMVSVGAGLLSSATGIGAKIDKAAGKVFGKDAVKLFNVAGTVYGMAGGFAGQGPSQVMDNVSGVFSGAPAAPTGPEVSSLQAAAEAGGPTTVDAFGNFGQPPTASSTGNPFNFNATGAEASPGFTAPQTVAPPVQQPPQSSLSKMWESLGPQGKAAAIQAGTQMVAGIAQGKAAQAQLDAEEERRRKREAPITGYMGRKPASALAAYNDFYARAPGTGG